MKIGDKVVASKDIRNPYNDNKLVVPMGTPGILIGGNIGASQYKWPLSVRFDGRGGQTNVSHEELDPYEEWAVYFEI